MGLLKPGDAADFIVVDNPENMNVLQTWIDGTCVYDGEKALFSPGTVAKINKFNCSRIRAEDLRVNREGDQMRVIVAINGELATFMEIVSAGSDPVVYPRLEDDILKIVIKERYHDGVPAVGFIKGFGLKEGAMATSVAHDSHNIIAVGVTDREIAEAINMIVDAEGGMSVVSDEETGILKLPVAGIMSDMPVTAMAQRYERLTETVKSLGCKLDAPYMTLSFMALLVIPELKLSDKGLFDGLAFRHVPLFV
jgi:adenine deaminase